MKKSRSKQGIKAGWVSAHPLYWTWAEIRRRCFNPKPKDAKYYKHVTISESWRESFWNFVNDMHERPSKKHTIDRVDGLKGYSKENCRWATPSQQRINQRRNGKSRPKQEP